MLSNQGYSFAAMDNRGHGKSEGQPCNTIERVSADQLSFLESVTSKAEVPVFLVAHGTGCLTALNLLKLSARGISGLAMLSPFFKFRDPNDAAR